MIVFLIGNKCEYDFLDNGIVNIFGEAKKFAEENDMIYYNCSAKNDLNVTDAFEDLMDKVYLEIMTLQIPNF